ncbi:MAG: hypothetical protein JXQ99_05700 [Hyphomicrobiaceae bacterium]
MANRLTIALPIGMRTEVTVSGEWIIVDQDLNGGTLLVSDAEALDIDNVPAEAPTQLTRRNTLIGQRARNEEAATTLYALLLSEPQDDVLGSPIEGTFFPSLGSIRVSVEDESRITLTGCGVVDRPNGNLLWSFDALRIPWQGDVFED